jgi:hypothetical protein
LKALCDYRGRKFDHALRSSSWMVTSGGQKNLTGRQDAPVALEV